MIHHFYGGDASNFLIPQIEEEENAHCVIWDNYRVTQPIVAELKILGEVRYPKRDTLDGSKSKI